MYYNKPRAKNTVGVCSSDINQYSHIISFFCFLVVVFLYQGTHTENKYF